VRRRRLGFGLFLSATGGVILGHAWTAAQTAWWWIGGLTLLSAALLVLSSFYVRGRVVGPPPRQQRPAASGLVVRWPVPTLGELLVEKYRLITVRQLEEALAKQGKDGGRLGDILVEMGLVSQSHLEAVLEDQHT
jgi:hypothetical protein